MTKPATPPDRPVTRRLPKNDPKAPPVPAWMRGRPALTRPVRLVPSSHWVLGRRALLLSALAALLALALILALVQVGGQSRLATSPEAANTPSVDTAFFPAGGGAITASTPGSATGSARLSDTPEQGDPPLPASLAGAWQAEQEGRYEDAIALYLAVAQALPPGPATPEARWHLATCRFEAGQYDASISDFAAFAHSYPNDLRSWRAAFWAGRAHLAAGRTTLALAELESYAPFAGALLGPDLLLAADAASASGDRNHAREVLNNLLAGPTTKLDRIGAWSRLASIEAASGSPAKAAALFMSVAGEASLPSYQAEVLLKSGSALLNAGQTGAGQSRLADLVRALPSEPAAYTALHSLLESDPQALSDGRLGYDIACHTASAAGHYAEAIGYCDNFRAGVAPGPGRADAAWWTARANEAAGNTQQAITWYSGFTEVYTADARRPNGLLHWGSLLAASGDVGGALALYDRLAATYPRSLEAAEAQDHAGVLLRRQGDFAAAAERWRAAASAPGADDNLRARALFWLGWTLQHQGKAVQPAAFWTQGAAYHTFWGARSADHLSSSSVLPRNSGPTDAERVRLLAAEADAGRATDADAELLRWAAAWSKPGNDVPTPGTVPARLAADPAYQRALALARVGLWNYTGTAWADLETTLEKAGDGTSLAALGLEARRSGWPWLAYPAGRSLARAAKAAGRPAGRADLPRAAIALLYPAAWPHLVAAEAGAQKVDPWLLLALVRQESAYDPSARSGADARGLTQVIPSTAEGLAASLGIADFHQTLLYRPAISLRLGAAYLESTLSQFDGNILYALAGYNAGPGNVPNWTGGRVNGDPDLFVDNIDYPETRDYVEIVYNNYAAYRWLWTQP